MMMLYTRNYVGSEDMNDLYVAFANFNRCLGSESQKMGAHGGMLTLASPSLLSGHFYSCLDESLFHYLQYLLKSFSTL